MFARRTTWPLLAVGLAVVGLHILNAIFLRASTAGSLAGNALQIFSSLFAAALCFQAARKHPGFPRSFWALVGVGMFMWAVADLGWAYNEIFLHSAPPPGSIVRFLLDTQGMFFVMAIFLDQEKTDTRIKLEEALDFVQVGILFFLIYFEAYYLPSVDLLPGEALAREVWFVMIADAGIVLLALVQWRKARSALVRELYGGLALYQILYASGAYSSELVQKIRPTPTGTLLDLAWTVPLLFAAFWAASWEPGAEGNRPVSRHAKSLSSILFSNGMFAFAPLVILFQVTEIGPEWRPLRFGLLGTSFLCYAVRLGLAQLRQHSDQETVRRQSLAMDISADGIGILNESGVHIYANSALAQLLGFEFPERIIGRPWRIVYAFQEMDRLEPEIRRSLARTRKWSASFALKRPDGSSVPVEMNVSAMPGGGTISVFRDLSQRHEAEKARADAETKYRMLVEQVNAVTYIAEIGINAQWYYVSPQIESIFGYTAEEWLPMSHRWADHIHPDDLPNVAAAEKASERGLPFQAEFRIKRKDGREVWLSDTAVVVKGSDSHPVMEGIIVDITERKVLETQLQQSRKMEAVGRLAGGIAHDFNNLLTIITGYTELALGRPTIAPDLRGDIERIENASSRAAALVRQLLAFSRKQVMQPKIVDPNAIVLNMDKLLRRLMDDHIEMITRVQADAGKIKADPAQLEQVLMNLVVNARDAMPMGGRLLVETANAELDAEYADEHVSVKPGRYVMIAVSDSGIGMSRETIAHIFEPFFTTKESGRGTGLGLSTVYGIVKQSGGYVWVYSEPGKGSTFKVYLPRVDGPAEELSPPQPPAHDRRGSETILLVEDEEAVRDLIETVLSEQGYTVIPAHDPKHAEEIAANHSSGIQLLLTDVVMPGTSGRELAAAISRRRPGISVLYMSGYTDNVITTGGLLEKGIAFLQKPFTPAVLTQKVREVLSRTPAL